MSIQSDVEMLSIRAMESYAKKNHMSGDDTMKTFHKYQIFEKMIMQHEYLHQISYDEVFEYVEKLIEEETKSLLVFHGTVQKFDEVDLMKSHNRRDFGMGFYTTVLENQAKEWAYRLSLRDKKKQYFVYQYNFKTENGLCVKRSDGLNEEWLEFVKDNRSRGGTQHNYDVVIGPVADDNTMETIQLYISGILNADEAVKRLRYNKVNNQVSFHTKKALKQLEFLRRISYE